MIKKYICRIVRQFRMRELTAICYKISQQYEAENICEKIIKITKIIGVDHVRFIEKFNHVVFKISLISIFTWIMSSITTVSEL